MQTMTKRGLCLLALLAAHGALAADRRSQTVSIDEVQKQLTTMLAASKDRLRRAERHHQRTVDRQRAAIAKDFDAMSGQLGGEVANFEASLVAAEARLEATINASEAEVKLAGKAPGGDDWQGTSFEQKVKLGAQAAAARRSLRHMRQARATQVHLAEHHAEEALEDETQRLGLVVGDLSKEFDSAKTAIEGNVSDLEESGNMTRDAVAAAPKVTNQLVAKTAEEEQHRIAALEKRLTESVKASKAVAAGAEKALAAALALEAKAQGKKAEDVIKAIKDSEHLEASTVAGRKAHAGKKQEKKEHAKGKDVSKLKEATKSQGSATEQQAKSTTRTGKAGKLRK